MGASLTRRRFKPAKPESDLSLQVNWLGLLMQQAGRSSDESDESNLLYINHLKPALQYLETKRIRAGELSTVGLVDSTGVRCSALEPLLIDCSSFTAIAKELVTKVHTSQFWYKCHYRTEIIDRARDRRIDVGLVGGLKPSYLNDWLSEKVIESPGGSIDLVVLLARLDPRSTIRLIEFKQWLIEAGLPVDDENRIPGWCGNWF